MSEIIVVPIGIKNPEGLEFLRKGIGEVLSKPCRIASPTPLPEEAFNKQRKQYLSSHLLDRLSSQNIKRGTVSIGVADVDLYVPELNFVFGQARLNGNACVISLHRLRQEIYCLPGDQNLFERRALTEAIHEIGHVFGLNHCGNQECVMFFSNSLVDTDRKGFNFCSKCLKRLKVGI